MKRANSQIPLNDPTAGFYKMAKYLSGWFADVTVYRFPDPEYSRFSQIVVIATRNTKPLPPQYEEIQHIRDLAQSELPIIKRHACVATALTTLTLPKLVVSKERFTFLSNYVDPTSAMQQAVQSGIRKTDDWATHLAPTTLTVSVAPLMPLFTAEGCDSKRESGCVTVLDMTTPTNPVRVNLLELPGRTKEITISSRMAYVADGPGGLRLIDISQPQEPHEVGVFHTVSYAQDVKVSDNHLFVTDTGNYGYDAHSIGGGLKIYALDNPSNPVTVGAIIGYGSARKMTISDSMTYLGFNYGYGRRQHIGYWGGLKTIDISNLFNPFELSYLEMEDDPFIGNDSTKPRGIKLHGK